MKRWLALSLGLATAAAGAYALLRGPAPSGRDVASGAGLPHEHIDAESRAQLEEILRDADRPEANER